MAKPTATSKDVAPPANSGTISVDAFATARAASLAEAGIMPYFTKDEKVTLAGNGVPLFVLGVRWKESTRFRDKNTGKFREDAELFVTTDLANPIKQGIWGGLPDTPYWRAMVKDLQALFAIAREQGDDSPSIGPVFAHEREYTNDWGTFPSYDFKPEPQHGAVSTPGAGVTPTGGADTDPDIPF